MRVLLERLAEFQTAVERLHSAGRQIDNCVRRGHCMADVGAEFWDAQEEVAEALIELELAYDPDGPE